MKQALIEAVKEFLRVVVLAVIPVLIKSLQSGEIDWRWVAVTGAIAGLRFIDKLLHETGKAQGSTLLKRGLTQF